MEKTILAVIISLALTGCAGMVKPSPISDPKTVWCDNNEPDRFTEAEIAALSDETARKSVEHNRKGAAWCGWTASAS